MYCFNNDYSEGAHPRIMEAMIEASLDQHAGYSMDTHTEHAKELIKKEIRRDDVDIHIIVGGTQTNMITISAALRPHQAVIAAETGHINVHETGSIESTGHKVLTQPAPDGKLTPELIQKTLDWHTDEHMVQPKMVYISNTTEIGTQYTLAELEALSRYCRQHDLYLFLDGARLGVALTSSINDLSLADIARLTDVFYIGGTKNGALFGEALVITHP
ncbi:MAG: aminotransferase class I/II-fold pyridoxal phosphate-dependent enzyme, partial [Lachnospiraceae bacterium]|nr:aminotransferase class I/II-fold pyridoxal phosphate-dependent enzyme [Lachnospiraceae bacterium]